MRFLLLNFLLLSISASKQIDASSCFVPIDLVIAVDTSSPCSDAALRNLLSQVKDLISGFPIGPNAAQVALIGMSETAQLLASFNDISSAVNFNSAVDRLKLTRKPASISAGMRLARESVLNIPKRDARVHRLLILVKDRQCVDLPDTDDAELASMEREAAAVKQMNCTIHAVGVGGLWLTKETRSIFGSEYLLFKNRNRVRETAKSMNGRVCPPKCRNIGQSTKTGVCYDKVRHDLHVSVAEQSGSSGDGPCRQEITRNLKQCDDEQSCALTERTVSECDSSGNAIVQQRLQFFDQKTQACATIENKETVSCDQAKQCTNQVADVIILLDQSGSLWDDFETVMNGGLLLIDSLYLGPDNVQLGVATFNDGVRKWLVKLGQHFDKANITAGIHGVIGKKYIWEFGTTQTDMALRTVKTEFDQRSRPNVPKFLIIITDGTSRYPKRTFAAISALKQIGVTIFVIAVQPSDIAQYGRLKMAELKMMTSPESDKNLFVLNNFTELESWAKNFSRRLCIDLAPINPKLCEEEIMHKSIVPCAESRVSKMQINWIFFKFDPTFTAVCIKHLWNNIINQCKTVCTDPIDGKNYIEGDVWTKLCHDFRCEKAGLVVVSERGTQCVAADLTCKSIDSPPFACRDIDGQLKASCRCVNKSGYAALVIDYPSDIK